MPIREAITYICPNDGSNVDFPAGKMYVKCKFCGSPLYRIGSSDDAVLDNKIKNAYAHLNSKRYDMAQDAFEDLVKNYSHIHHGWLGLVLCRTKNYTEDCYDIDFLVNHMTEVKKYAPEDEYEAILDDYFNYIEKGVALRSAINEIDERFTLRDAALNAARNISIRFINKGGAKSKEETEILKKLDKQREVDCKKYSDNIIKEFKAIVNHIFIAVLVVALLIFIGIYFDLSPLIVIGVIGGLFACGVVTLDIIKYRTACSLEKSNYDEYVMKREEIKASYKKEIDNLLDIGSSYSRVFEDIAGVFESDGAIGGGQTLGYFKYLYTRFENKYAPPDGYEARIEFVNLYRNMDFETEINNMITEYERSAA